MPELQRLAHERGEAVLEMATTVSYQNLGHSVLRAPLLQGAYERQSVRRVGRHEPAQASLFQNE